MNDKDQNKRGVENDERNDENSTTLHRLSDDSAAFNGEGNGPAHGAQPSAAGSETQQLKADLEKAKREHLYLLAEFDNFKKNVIKERSDLRKYGSERLVVELLNVLDIFDTALKTPVTPENLESFKKGIELTASEFRAALSRFGVEEIPAEGKPFDPSLHEAISSEETDAVPEGHVSRVFKKPFKLYERVIRPGQVVVARPKSKS